MDTSEAKFRALLEAAPDGMIIVDPSGRIRLVNVQAEQMFGYDRRELLGQPVEILVPEPSRPAHAEHRDAYAKTARRRPMGAGLDLRGRRKDGSEFPVEISLSPLDTDEGRLVVSAIRDITERRQAEQERTRLINEREAQAEASRIKDEFLATLSHELRTPLNAILGWISLLRDSKMGTDQAARALATIERNARAQAQLVEDLLDVSRIVTGKLRLQVQPIDLATVIEQAVDVMRPAAAARRISVEVHLETRPVLMMGDPDRLQQALWNLLSNSVKFSNDGGRIEVRLWTGEQQVSLAVRDTGRGIPPDFVPHVFDRFRQADGSYTREHGGLGLGLAIARSVVELHGGSIRAHSSGLGHGATFAIDFPLAHVSGSPEHLWTPSDALDPLDGLDIFVVDDQPDERELLMTMLEQQGARVTTFASGDEALDAIATTVPDVLVSDIAMPGRDGYGLIRAIRQMPPPMRSVPAIAVTAHARAEDREQALAAGFQVYVAKPVNRGRLIRAVATLGQAAQRVRRR